LNDETHELHVPPDCVAQPQTAIVAMLKARRILRRITFARAENKADQLNWAIADGL
jgi:hypothetical protein